MLFVKMPFHMSSYEVHVSLFMRCFPEDLISLLAKCFLVARRSREWISDSNAFSFILDFPLHYYVREFIGELID